MKNPAHNIYIHVPYCASKCNYCAFFSRACPNPDWGKYTEEICKEIKYWANKLGRINVPTVFFGGGTPSLMPVECIGTIIDLIANHFNLDTGAEITMESNPGTLDANKLAGFVSTGVNRISIGIQRFDDATLKFLGRRHSAADAMQILDTAMNMGVRVSADLIYGLPGDTPDTVVKICKRVNQIGLNHCSMYELTIEPGTPFAKMDLDMPGNEALAQMYVAISETLGLERYEISNYAMAGHECAHNANVWDGDAYVGIGQGAAGRVFMDGVWYEQLGNRAQFSPIDNTTRATEQIITGMRTVRGCKLTDDVKRIIDMEWVNNNPHLVQIRNNRIAPTGDGMLVCDKVILDLVK